MQLSKYPEHVEKISVLLGKIYVSVNWRAIKGRSSYDVFQHRLNVAVRQSTITAFIQKLCHGLNLQAPSIDPKLIEWLDEEQEIVFMLLREGTQYFTYKAAENARELKKLYKKEVSKED